MNIQKKITDKQIKTIKDIENESGMDVYLYYHVNGSSTTNYEDFKKMIKEEKENGEIRVYINQRGDFKSDNLAVISTHSTINRTLKKARKYANRLKNWNRKILKGDKEFVYMF